MSDLREPRKAINTPSIRATEWRERNPERFKQNTQRYLENNRELVSLRQKRTWLFSKKGKGCDVDEQILEIEKLIGEFISRRSQLKNA